MEESDESAPFWTRSLVQKVHGFIVCAFHVARYNDENAVKPKRHIHWKNNSFEFVQAHMFHGIVNMAISLLGFAVLINSL